MDKDLLDSDFFSGWGNFVFSEEEIKWKGKPTYEYSIRFLGGGNYYDAETGGSSMSIIYIIGLCLTLYGIVDSGFPILGIIFGVAGFVLPFIYEHMNVQNHRKTEYAITEEYVVFKFFNFINYKFKAIPISTIRACHLVPYDSRLGTIHLITNKQTGFSTYYGRTMKKQDHITLELLSDYKEVNALLQGLIKDNRIKPTSYKEPEIGQPILRFTKLALMILAGFLTLYLIDYFVIPTKKMEDVVEKSYRYRFHETTEGYKFTTQEGSRLIDKEVEFDATSVFGTVKNLKYDLLITYKDLSSGLGNKIFLASFVVFYAIIIGCNLKFYRIETMRQIVYVRIAIASTAGTGMMWMIWCVVN